MSAVDALRALKGRAERAVRLSEALLERWATVTALRLPRRLRSHAGQPRTAEVSRVKVAALLREHHRKIAHWTVETLPVREAPRPLHTGALTRFKNRILREMTLQPHAARVNTRPVTNQLRRWIRGLTLPVLSAEAELTAMRKALDEAMWAEAADIAIDVQLRLDCRSAAEYNAFYAHVPQDALRDWIIEQTPDAEEVGYDQWERLSGGIAVRAIARGWEIYEEGKKSDKGSTNEEIRRELEGK